MFDAHAYFEKEIRDKMKATVNGNYSYARVTSISHLEEVLQKFRTQKNFFAVDDSENGYTFMKGGSFFERKSITIYVMKEFDIKKQESQVAAQAECKHIYDTVLKKLIKDKAELANQMVYLVTDQIPFQIIPGYFANGCTGIFFTVPVDIPTNLCYNPDEWL